MILKVIYQVNWSKIATPWKVVVNERPKYNTSLTKKTPQSQMSLSVTCFNLLPLNNFYLEIKKNFQENYIYNVCVGLLCIFMCVCVCIYGCLFVCANVFSVYACVCLVPKLYISPLQESSFVSEIRTGGHFYLKPSHKSHKLYFQFLCDTPSFVLSVINWSTSLYF